MVAVVIVATVVMIVVVVVVVAAAAAVVPVSAPALQYTADYRIECKITQFCFTFTVNNSVA